jgi:lipoprotein-releasing system permease protein
MRYETFIALRYLRSRRSFGFVTLISVISVAGITIGVAALIIVLSVFNGFSGLVTNILTSFDPHVRIERPERSSAISYGPVLTALPEYADVRGASSFVNGKALVIMRNATRVVNVKGVDPSTVDSVSGLRDKIVLGEPLTSTTGVPGIILGMTLADRLGAVVGDTLAIVSPAAAMPAIAQLGMPLIRRFVVQAMYESNNKDYDSFYAFVTLTSAQDLFRTGESIDGIDVRLTSITEAGHLKKKLEERFGAGVRVLTWYDLHRELYSVMQIERWAAYVILSLIIAVASFNLLGSLTMTVIEKTRDVGILKTMGASPASVARIFLGQGIMVGVVGTLLGTGIGLLVVWMQEVYHLFPLDPTVYIISALPVEARWTDVLVVAAAAIGLSALAARSPARRAARLIPVEAIRWE